MTVGEVAPDAWDGRVLGTPGLVLVDVWAPWCIPCKRLEPVIAAISERHGAAGLTCLRLNADDAPDLVARYGVLSLPTVLLFRGGEEVARVAGVPKRGRLEQLVEGLLG